MVFKISYQSFLLLLTISLTAMEMENATQEEFDAIAFPGQRNEIVNQAIKQLQENDKHKESLNILKCYSYNVQTPCIPAIRYLTNRALKKQKLDKVAVYSGIGSTYNDPWSAFIYATCLDNAEEIAGLAHINPIEREISLEQSLAIASQTYRVPIKSDTEIIYKNFCLPTAMEQFKDFRLNKYGRFQEAYEKALILGKEIPQIPGLEGLLSLGNICDSIKKYSKQQSEENYAKALSLAENKALDVSQFTLEYFVQSGAYDAISQIAKLTVNEQVTMRSNFLLGQLGHQYIMATHDQQDLQGTCSFLNQASIYDLRALLLLSDLQQPQESMHTLHTLLERLDQVTPVDYPTLFRGLVARLAQWGSLGCQEAIDMAIRVCKNHTFKCYKQNQDCTQDVAISYQLGSAFASLYALQENKTGKKKYKDIKHEARVWLKKAQSLGSLEAQWELLSIENQVDLKMVQTTFENTRKSPFRQSLQSCIMTALRKLEAQKQIHYKELGLLYLQGLPGYVEKDEVKASQLLLKDPHAMEILISHSDQWTDPKVSLALAEYLYQNQDKNSSWKIAYSHYMACAINKGDMDLKKTIIKEGLQKNSILDETLQAVEEYCKQLGTNQETSNQEFLRETITVLNNRAVAGNNEAANFLAQLLTNYSDIRHPEISDNKVRAIELTAMAAQRGDFRALCTLIPAYEVVEPSPISFIKAAEFWYDLHNASKDNPHRVAQHNNAINQMRLLVAQWNHLVKEKTFEPQHPTFNLYAATVLLPTHMHEAIPNYIDAVNILITYIPSNGKELLERLNIENILEKNIQEGYGWASFAKALLTFYDAQCNAQRKYALQNVQALESIRALLHNAQTAVHPFADFGVLNESDIDYFIGVQFEGLAQKSSDEARKYAALHASNYLKKAAQAGNIKAKFAWADRYLYSPYENRNDEDFRLAISWFQEGALNGNQTAQKILEKMAQDGMGFTSVSGGTMTTQLLQDIQDTLFTCNPTKFSRIPPVQDKQNDLEIPDNSMAYAKKSIQERKEYEKAYEILKEFESQGDKEALVYLGIMYRDGLHVAKSRIMATSYFKKALLDGNFIRENVVSLNIAYEELTQESQKDILALIARLRFQTQVELFLNKKTTRFVELCQNLAMVETLTQNNSDNCKAFFESDVHNMIIDLYEGRENIPLLLSYISIYLSFVLQNKNMAKDKLSKMLDYLKDKLCRKACHDHKIVLLHDVSDQIIKAILQKLQQCYELGHQSCGRILGLLHIVGGAEKKSWANVKKGFEVLKKVAITDQEAGVFCGILNIVGQNLDKQIPYAPKIGQKVLEDLATKNCRSAQIALGRYHLLNDRYEEGRKWLHAALTIPDITNPEIATELAMSYLHDKTPTVIKNSQIIQKILQEASKHPSLKDLAQLYRGCLEVLSGNMPVGFSYLTQSLNQLWLDGTLVKVLLKLCVDHQLNTRLVDFCKQLEKSTQNTDQDIQLLANAYYITAGIHFIFANAFIKPHERAFELAKTKTYLDKIFSFKNDDIPYQAYCLRARINLETPDGNQDFDTITKDIIFAFHKLKKENLTLEDSPFFEALICDFNAIGLVKAAQVADKEDQRKKISQKLALVAAMKTKFCRMSPSAK